MFDAYDFGKYIPECFPFGDNGGGKAFLFMQGASNGTGVYMVPYGDIDRASAVFISRTIKEMIHEGAGLDVILSNI